MWVSVLLHISQIWSWKSWHPEKILTSDDRNVLQKDQERSSFQEKTLRWQPLYPSRTSQNKTNKNNNKILVSSPLISAETEWEAQMSTFMSCNIVLQQPWLGGIRKGQIRSHDFHLCQLVMSSHSSSMGDSMESLDFSSHLTIKKFFLPSSLEWC